MLFCAPLRSKDKKIITNYISISHGPNGFDDFKFMLSITSSIKLHSNVIFVFMSALLKLTPKYRLK